MKRAILHCDINNCYASIELIRNPKLKKFPVAVCGSKEDRHGIVLAKNEIAKNMGVKTGQVIWQAQSRCKNLKIIKPHYNLYLMYSKKIKEIYYRYTDRIESFGIDECWLDVTSSLKLYKSAYEIARQIKEAVKKELQLTISVGISYNKIFAKLAGDLADCDEIQSIGPDELDQKVFHLEVDNMIGIGKKTKQKLNRIGVFTLGDLAKIQRSFLTASFGVIGGYLHDNANGKNTSEVKYINQKSDIKSIGRGITLREDLDNESEVESVMMYLMQKVSANLIENEFLATGIEITIRDTYLLSYTYRMSNIYPTYSSIKLTNIAMKLFLKKHDDNFPLRSISVRAINLIDSKDDLQIDIFNDYHSEKKFLNLEKTLYNIRKKYNNNIIKPAFLLKDNKLPKKEHSTHLMPEFIYT